MEPFTIRGDAAEITFFSAFGEELGSSLSPWRFSSKRMESMGLVYYGRRFYDPKFGRWLSPDPAGFTDGINLYAFVKNCPLTHIDDYGLFGLAHSYLCGRFPYTLPPPTHSRILPSIQSMILQVIYNLQRIGQDEPLPS